VEFRSPADPQLIPDIDALPQEFKVFQIRHCSLPPSAYRYITDGRVSARDCIGSGSRR
jgi:hypothetical protein